MQDTSPNKAMKASDVKKKDGILESYFFPDYQINIEASSIEDAEEKLKAIINKK